MYNESLKIYLKRVWELVSEPSSILLTLIFLAPKSQEEGKEIAAPPPYLNICSSVDLVVKRSQYMHYLYKSRKYHTLLSALVCMIYLANLMNGMILHLGIL